MGRQADPLNHSALEHEPYGIKRIENARTVIRGDVDRYKAEQAVTGRNLQPRDDCAALTVQVHAERTGRAASHQGVELESHLIRVVYHEFGRCRYRTREHRVKTHCIS